MEPLEKGFDAADELAIAKRNEALRYRDARELERIRVLFGAEGTAGIMARHWLWDKLHAHGVFDPLPDGNGTMMFIAEGKRRMGLKMFNDINLADEDLYHLMAKEANQREKDLLEKNKKGE